VKVIDKYAVLSAALVIVDREGLAALNIRRLGDELGVHGASLYHYFESKDDILQGVQGLALARLRVHEIEAVGRSWQDWLIDMTIAFREALLAHPNVAPLMMHGESNKLLGAEVRDAAVRVLVAGGVPEPLVMSITESFETLAFGSAMIDPAQRGFAPLDGADEIYPDLASALRTTTDGPGERFEAAAWALISGWEAVIERTTAPPPTG
jgi:AcrR family transcriptional regulator